MQQPVAETVDLRALELGASEKLAGAGRSVDRARLELTRAGRPDLAQMLSQAIRRIADVRRELEWTFCRECGDALEPADVETHSCSHVAEPTPYFCPACGSLEHDSH